MADFAFPENHDIAGVASNAFPRAKFGDVEFPYHDLSVKGGIRFAQHEFPHSPGAEIEKMGRRAYTFVFQCDFHDIPGSAMAKTYPNIYPSKLATLREYFEKEMSLDLVVPTIGTITAVATSWIQNYNVEHATGESVILEFIEDQDPEKGFGAAIDLDPPGVAQMQEANDKLLAAAAKADALKANTQSIFQDINDAITQVQGVFGQADAYSRLVEGKIRAVENLCIFADSQLEDLQDPVNHLILDALKDLWAATVQLADNVIETKSQLREYRVTKLMSIQQIAATLYGSTDRTMELLQLNSFNDALAIPAGTLVIYVA